MTTTQWDAETVPKADVLARQTHVLPLLANMGSILEVGSGKGRNLRLLATPDCLVLGVDISIPVLAIAQADGRFNNLQADAEYLPVRSTSFDAAMATDVLEHITDWGHALDELFRVARQRVVITVPCGEWLRRQRCPQCGARVPFYGHLHSFRARSFAPWDDRGRMTIRRIAPPYGWRGYWRKGLRWARRQQHPDDGMLRCFECGTFMRPGLRWQRAFDRLFRLVTHKPEWLLVVWEIGNG